MTTVEYRLKYPIGTKIRYIGNDGYDITGDRGKIGKIVNFDHRERPIIFLPESTNVSSYSTLQIPATWQTNWTNIEILLQKNQQLLFSFMD